MNEIPLSGPEIFLSYAPIGRLTSRVPYIKKSKSPTLDELFRHLYLCVLVHWAALGLPGAGSLERLCGSSPAAHSVPAPGPGRRCRRRSAAPMGSGECCSPCGMLSSLFPWLIYGMLSPLFLLFLLSSVLGA